MTLLRQCSHEFEIRIRLFDGEHGGAGDTQTLHRVLAHVLLLGLADDEGVRRALGRQLVARVVEDLVLLVVPFSLAILAREFSFKLGYLIMFFFDRLIDERLYPGLLFSFNFFQLRLGILLYFFEVNFFFLLFPLPLGILLFLQHATEVHSASIRHVELHLRRVFAVLVPHDALVDALIVGLGLPDAEGDAVGSSICVHLVAPALLDLHDAFAEPHLRHWVALHDQVDVAIRIFDGVVLELHIHNGGGAWGAHGLERRARQVHLIVAVRSYGAAPVRAGAPPTLHFDYTLPRLKLSPLDLLNYFPRS